MNITLPFSEILSEMPLVKSSLKEAGSLHTLECPLENLIDVVTKLKKHFHDVRLANLFATDDRSDAKTFGLWVVLSLDREGQRILMHSPVAVATPHFPTLSHLFVNSARFERNIWDMFGLIPDGHPELKPVSAHDHWPEDAFPLRKDFAWDTKLSRVENARPYAFKRYEGEGVYEIPVGPIHAGVIEPGHFRFQVAGESIQNLEIRLGWVHRGVEKLFENIAHEKTVALSEQVSGDNSFSHSAAFCMAVEESADISVPKRAQMIRTILLELERINLHVHDLANMCVGIAFNFGASQLWILREQLLELNRRLTGSRFLRGVNQWGGVSMDLSDDMQSDLLGTLKHIIPNVERVVDVVLDSPSCLDRLQTAGVLRREIAQDLGVVGIAARCTGLDRDVRRDFPYGAYSELAFDVPTKTEADVLSRYILRRDELLESWRLIKECLKKMPKGHLSTPVSLKPNQIGCGVIETNRGELQYWVMTDKHAKFHRVSVCDPAFHNWDALAWCVLGNIVPDFPLCNKSFNLSYAGHDL